MAYGVLDAEWSTSLTMEEARRIAGRAIESAAERDVRTGIGIDVAEETPSGVEISQYVSAGDLE